MKNNKIFLIFGIITALLAGALTLCFLWAEQEFKHSIPTPAWIIPLGALGVSYLYLKIYKEHC